MQAKTRESQQTIQSLSDRLGDLTSDIGMQKAGKAFEVWFYDLMEFSEIVARRPYKTEGRGNRRGDYNRRHDVSCRV